MNKTSKQLGINFSTASNRLKKNIFLDLIQRLKLDECFRCKKPIKNAIELSIEHKIAWLDNNPSLFWDLNNISFSHLSCNRLAARKQRIVQIDGMRWCGRCKSYKISAEFGSLKNCCRPCDRLARGIWRANKKAKISV